jgi:hypothetical protein
MRERAHIREAHPGREGGVEGSVQEESEPVRLLEGSSLADADHWEPEPWRRGVQWLLEGMEDVAAVSRTFFGGVRPAFSTKARRWAVDAAGHESMIAAGAVERRFADMCCAVADI